MAPRIRPARPEDVVSVTPWTRNTFSWGDYIPERMPIWLTDDESEVLVCVDDRDEPIALAHVTMLSPAEAWIEGARVHPDHRRTGLGTALNHAGVEWARARGGRVMRLTTEADNGAARTQVEGLGYRKVSNWVFASLDVDLAHRAADQYRLRPAPGSDAEAAWLFWAVSDLAREGRELIAIGWQWRTARPADVTGLGEMVQSPAGWISLQQPEDDWIRTLWFATTPEGLLPLLDGLLDLAAGRAVTEIDVKLPNLGWTAEALTRFGGDPKEVLVYAKPI
jgi:GNAT superfamily N-acetyltransferase